MTDISFQLHLQLLKKTSTMRKLSEVVNGQHRCWACPRCRFQQCLSGRQCTIRSVQTVIHWSVVLHFIAHKSVLSIIGNNLLAIKFKMKRLLLDTLLTWKKKTSRKPLVIDGARQTGKTYLLQTLLGNHPDRGEKW